MAYLPRVGHRSRAARLSALLLFFPAFHIGGFNMKKNLSKLLIVLFVFGFLSAVVPGTFTGDAELQANQIDIGRVSDDLGEDTGIECEWDLFVMLYQWLGYCWHYVRSIVI